MMDPRSERNLQHVHIDLVRVVRGAAQSPARFVVVYGVRLLTAEAEAVRTGHSHTLHSRHLLDPRYMDSENPDGVSCAVDVAALDKNGAIDWAKGREEKVYGQIAEQIRSSAEALKVPLQWGGAEVGAWTPGVVSHFRDWSHFQLPWESYP